MTQLIQVAEGLNHLHSRTPSIAHGDVKIDNILINDQGDAVLTDFGLSRLLNELGEPTGFTTSGRGQGGYGYRSPEILNGDLPSAEADAYAFGSLILTVRKGSASLPRDITKLNDLPCLLALYIGHDRVRTILETQVRAS